MDIVTHVFEELPSRTVVGLYSFHCSLFCEMKNLKHFMDSSVIAVQDLENLFEK